MKRLGILTIAAALLITAQPAAAQQKYPNPYRSGDYWTVVGIHIKAGGTLKAANDIADVWQKQQEFAKSKGWISGYKILNNPYPRENEPSIYLITMTPKLASPDEIDQRGVEMREFMKMSAEQMQAAAAGRAEYLTQGDVALMREWIKR